MLLVHVLQIGMLSGASKPLRRALLLPLLLLLCSCAAAAAATPAAVHPHHTLHSLLAHRRLQEQVLCVVASDSP
jgi:hypothetical protein